MAKVHGIGKGSDPNMLLEKQVIKAIVTSEVEGLGQGRAGFRWKIKTPMPPPIIKPIVKLIEKPIEQPKVILKVPIPESSRKHDKITPIPDYAIPQTGSGYDSSSIMVKRKTIQDISREIPMYPDPVYRPPPNPVELSIPEVPRNISDLYP